MTDAPYEPSETWSPEAELAEACADPAWVAKWGGPRTPYEPSEVARLQARVAEFARGKLVELMSDISESCWCAGWLTGNEYALWEAHETGPQPYGMSEIDQDDCDQLRRLSAEAKGWWKWDDASEYGEVFVPIDAWREHVAELAARRQEAKAGAEGGG